MLPQFKFLVIGCTTDETIYRQETGECRQGIGGVAGNMAYALGVHGQDVTLVTSLSLDSQGDLVRMAFGLDQIISAPHHLTGKVVITTRAGEQVRASGSWPSVCALPDDIKTRIQDTDSILLDCTLPVNMLSRVLELANQYDKPVTVNATTKSRSKLITATAQYPKQLITMNQQEYTQVERLSRSLPLAGFLDQINTESLLVTRGSQGWNLYDRSGYISSDALEVPPNTDFVGCGDFAAAGAAYALTADLPVVETVNGFIKTRMRLNCIS